MDLPRPLLDSLMEAYAAGQELNERVQIVDLNLTAGGGAIDASTNAGRQATFHQRALSDKAIDVGKTAKPLFEKARDELAKL